MPHKRIFGLDLLRSIAILCVMTYHCLLVVFDEHIEWVLYAPIPDGVELFFVLSGFLIGTIFIRKFEEKSFNLLSVINFWKNRWFRTLPAYYFTLFLLVIIFRIKKGTFPHFSKYVFFIKTFIYPKNGVFPESWSLAIEEWFYLTMPIIVFVIFLILYRLLSKKYIFLLYIFLIILFSIILRWIIYINIPKDATIIWGELFRSTTILRLDSIIYGVFAAYLSYYHNEIFLKYKKKNLVIGIIGIMILFQYYKLNYKINEFSIFFRLIYFPLCSFCVMLTLPFLSTYTGKNIHSLFSKFIIRTSLISYSLYLVNLTLIGENLRNLTIPDSYKFILFWILCFISAEIIYRCIEKPFMNLREKINISETDNSKKQDTTNKDKT